MVNLGNISIAGLRLGATQVKAAYLGGEQFWGGGEPVPTAEPLCFTRTGRFNTYVQLNKNGSPDPVSLEYSTDGETWTDYEWDGTQGTQVSLSNTDDKVYFRAKSENLTFSKDASNFYTFITAGWSSNISITGNIQSLLKADCSRTDAPAYCYYRLLAGRAEWASVPSLPATALGSYCYAQMFSGCASLTTAPALPATTLADNCYSNMFSGCTSLTAAPALPATTLASYCYTNMFFNCTSLTAAPALPATTLASNCYQYMFYNCTSLTTAPELPAMNLAQSGYGYMFYGCTALTSAPALPATTLTTLCYDSMFLGCSALTDAPELPAETLASSCYAGMFKGCSSLSSMSVNFTNWLNGATTNWLSGTAATGTFNCLSGLDTTTRDASHVPVDWTVMAPADWLCFTAAQANSSIHLDKAGSPGAVSLETSTDGTTWTDYAWSGDTGGTLTLANIGDRVYFRAKTENLTIGSSASDYYKFVMSGQIAASGNIQSLLKADCSRTDAPAYCYHSMFSGCTSLTAAPALPATTLSQYCYRNMFQNCAALTTAPDLPATTLAEGCYSQMFSGCTSLATAPTLPATTLATSCYGSMFKDCSSLTTAPELPATTLVGNCYNGMFSGCTSLSSVGVSFTVWSSLDATTNWLNNVAATGTFACPAALPDVRDASHIPTGWQVVNPVKPLCFTATQSFGGSVRLDKSGSPGAVSLETSTDGTTWTDYAWSGSTGNTVTLAGVGDKVYFRAKNENLTFSTSGSSYYKFITSGQLAASGNIQTLLKADGSRTDAPAYCYYSLFQGQTNLVSAPELPAVSAGELAYANMFNGCTSLNAAPSELPLTAVAEGCCQGMFYSCSSLSSAMPALPATTLYRLSYASMFDQCTHLTAAPAISATTLADTSLGSMFYNCGRLSSVEVAFTAWSPSNATDAWLNSVAASGTFTCPAALPDIRGASRIPTGWTKTDVA